MMCADLRERPLGRDLINVTLRSERRNPS